MEKQINIPQLRFPDFTGEWEVKKLGEVADFKVTNSFSRENLNYESGTVKNIHYGDIHTKFQTLFDITKEKVPFINEEMNIGRIINDFYCREGDIVFADASEDLNDVGKSIEIINLNNEKLLSGLHTLLARPQNGYFQKGFNGYLFKSNNVRLQIKKEAQGSKVLSVNVGRISNINISFPSLPEQQKIATFLTATDDKLQALKKKKALLEQYKKGVMQKLFSQELRFKDENGGDFPEWEERKLSDLIRLQGGFAFKSKEFKTKGIPVIRISNISNDNNYINLSNVVYYDKINNAQKFTIEKWDLIIAMSGATTGKSSIYNLDEIAYLNQRVGLFRPIEKSLYYGFLIQFVFSDLFKQQLEAFLVAGAQPNISSSDIERISLSYPSSNEQSKIATFLSTLDEKINQVAEQIAQTATWKKGLLQKMFI